MRDSECRENPASVCHIGLQPIRRPEVSTGQAHSPTAGHAERRLEASGRSDPGPNFLLGRGRRRPSIPTPNPAKISACRAC